jgi:hypothetical protein
MSASSAPIPRTIACQLFEALERYQSDVGEMVESWGDTADFHIVTRELQDIRTMKGSLPGLSNEMAEVLIRHVELVQALWDSQSRPHADGIPVDLKRLRQRHATAVEAMRGKCRLLSDVRP